MCPPIWPSEVANGIRMAERRKRISVTEGEAFLSLLLQYPIKVVSLPPATVFQEVLSLARAQGLTVYDAFYLNLASQGGLPLATFDDLLRTAAVTIGVTLFPNRKS
jgi:predicted nucleic acid-binding protein